MHNDNDEVFIQRSNTNFLPLILSNELKLNNDKDSNNNKINEEEIKYIENDDNEQNENIDNNINNDTKEKKLTLSNKNILNKLNINISNVTNRTLVSNKALQNIKGVLFDKKPKNNKRNSLFKKQNLLCLSNTPNYYSSNIYNSFNQPNILCLNENKIQNNNNNKIPNNNDINNLINYNYNNKNIKNSSMIDLKNNSYNNDNKNNNNNKIEIDFNRSDSLNKSSSYLFSCLLNNYSKLKKPRIKRKNVYKNTINKLSPYIKFSKNENISSKQIYRHYLKETYKDYQTILKKRRNKISKKFNGSYDYSHVICPGLKRIYGYNENFMNRMNEIKKNNNIAFKNDFNIKDYQNTLIKLMKNNVSEKYLNKLQNNYMKFNEKNYGLLIPKGRYINLANKLKNHLSGDALENLKKMDKNYHIYYQKKNKEKKNRKEFVDMFKKVKFK